MPLQIRKLLARVLGLVAARSASRSLLNRAQRFMAASVEPSENRYARLMCYFDREQKAEIYARDMVEALAGIDSYDLITNAYGETDATNQIDALLATDVATYLPGDLLVKMDIATMANSLEARSPFLDHQFMEFAASLPPSMKVRGLTGKYILKKVADGWLPPEVIHRPKMGFGVPIATWLRTDLRDMTRDLLTDSTASSRGYFDKSAVQNLIESHQSGVNRSKELWALLQLELWHRMFIDGNASHAPTTSLTAPPST